VIGKKVRAVEARKAEIAALREAVRHGRSRRNCDKAAGPQWVMLDGIACYDRWAREFEQPDRKRGSGDAYCYGIYRRTHRSAAGFLREIAPKYPKAEGHLRAAADHFLREADTLDSAEELLGWGAPAGPDPEQNRKVASILARARDHYAAGIGEIETALHFVGSEQ
jgi:hypothetical protein